MKRNIYILLSLILCAMWTSCEKDDRPSAEVRVLLVYVGADNNLSGYEQQKLRGLRQGWSGKPDDHILAYIDKSGGEAMLVELAGPGVSGSAGDDANGFNVIASYGRENSASAATLRRVIDDARSLYDPDSFGLLVFSHASGWLPSGTFTSFEQGRIPDAATGSSYLGPMTADGSRGSRSIIVDGNDEMELSAFSDAIPDHTLDYIVFETCFMAGIEVAWELRDKAPLILASSAEIVHPGFAPVYSSATVNLMGRDLAGFGQRVIDHTLTYAEGSLNRSATVSVIATTGLTALASFVRDNCDLSREVDITELQRFDRLQNATLFFDFEDYYGRLLKDPAKRQELSRLVAQCIRWKAATDGFMNSHPSYNGFSVGQHSGMTAYVPQNRFSGLNAAYMQTAWGRWLSSGLSD